MEQFIEAIWKSLLIFVLLIVLARAIGRKLLSQMSFFGYIVAVTIGTVSGAYITETLKGTWVLVSPVILTLVTILFGYINIKSPHMRKLTEGEPVVVVQNGKILDKNLLKLRYHIDDLEMQLRDKGVFNFADVEFAVLEPQGKLSVLKKSQNQPVTPKDLNIKTQYKGLATEIIKNGLVYEDNLKQNNLSFDWLYQELKKQNIDKVSDVMYAALNTDGTLYIDLRDDKMDYIQKIED